MENYQLKIRLLEIKKIYISISTQSFKFIINEKDKIKRLSWYC